MKSQLTPAQQREFYAAMSERARLYEQLSEKVKGLRAIITNGSGWYKELVGREFIINGVQNVDGHPHFTIEGGEDVIAGMTRIKYICWKDCEVFTKTGLAVSIVGLVNKIRRAERIISG